MTVIAATRPIAFDGERKSQLETARFRLMLIAMLMFLSFGVLGYRTLDIGMSSGVVHRTAPMISVAPVELARADILDRNGEVLATNLETYSLYADTRMIKNPEEVAAGLVRVLPELTMSEVEAKLKSGRSFVWLKRKLTPSQHWAVNALGVPGFNYRREEERVYPHGSLASHVLGYVDTDGNGLGGVEHFFDDTLGDKSLSDRSLKLSLDIRVQHALADELQSAMRAHEAIGAGGLVMDVQTGELLALVSMPDFDPNQSGRAQPNAMFNRVTMGLYELGSTFKTFTLAAALDSGQITMNDGYDATKPIRISKYWIRDDHPKARYLSVPEIYTYSSNIGMAHMADEMGGENQRNFLRSLGLLDPATIELTEVGAPVYPKRWGRVHTMTIAYGHGIQVSPLNLASGIASMVNGGRLIPATLVYKDDNAFIDSRRVVKASTSDQVRKLMRMVVKEGTGSNAEAIGYRVGGKTGTAEKAKSNSRGYDRKSLISSFIGVYPMDKPQFVVFAMLDEPKGNEATHGFAGGGWTAAPTVRNVIMRTAPLLGVAPKDDVKSDYQNIAMLIAEGRKKDNK